jgi:hypothetical protein
MTDQPKVTQPGSSVIYEAREALRAVVTWNAATGLYEDTPDAQRCAADAAVRVVLEHLRDQITPIWDGDEEVDDAVSGRHIRNLLNVIAEWRLL